MDETNAAGGQDDADMQTWQPPRGPKTRVVAWVVLVAMALSGVAIAVITLWGP